MEAAAARTGTTTGEKARESLLRRKYVIPFVLACVILACNQATGINSILGYNTTILLQGGLSDLQAHWGYVILTLVNFLLTIGGILLVDRKGRKFLLSLGSAGIIVSLVAVGALFRQTERHRVDVQAAVQGMVGADQRLSIAFDQGSADRLLAVSREEGAALVGRPATLIVIYSYGGFRAATAVARSRDTGAAPLQITRESCVPANRVLAFFSNPFVSLDAARTAPLRNRKRPDHAGAGRAPRMAHRARPVLLHGVLRRRARRVRLAGGFPS